MIDIKNKTRDIFVLCTMGLINLIWSNQVLSQALDTTLTMEARASIPVGESNLKFKIINTGNDVVYNVHANLPEEWTEVTQDVSQCLTIAPDASCELIFTSTKPYLAKIVSIQADNMTPSQISLAFTLHGFLVFRINDVKHSASVIYPHNSPKATWIYDFWDNSYLVGATSMTDGKENTKKIYDVYSKDRSWNPDRQSNFGAAVYCAKIKDEKGGWYLPAFLQMYSFHKKKTDNLQEYSEGNESTVNRLLQLGFGDLDFGSYWDNSYWTSTEVNDWDIDFYEKPSAKAVCLSAFVYKGHRYDQSAALNLRRGAQYKSRCVKDMVY